MQQSINPGQRSVISQLAFRYGRLSASVLTHKLACENDEQTVMQQIEQQLEAAHYPTLANMLHAGQYCEAAQSVERLGAILESWF